MDDGLKADLHVHSKMSTRPSQWILQKLDCPESYTAPEQLYRIARDRGMDLVTITDHNTIDGALEIAHLEGVFISEEVTAYFPENNCKLHILALNISEAQHAEISYIRSNVYDLAAYLSKEKICHVLAHPMFDLNHRLSIEYFEKMLLLFSHFECNGSRDSYQNKVLESILGGLTRRDIEHLANKHGIAPVGPAPWIKHITGGSDDHSSLNIARMHTIVPGASTPDEFFRGLWEGRCKCAGDSATPRTLAHNLYGIAYQYYSARYNLGRYAGKSLLFRFVHGVLTPGNPERGLFTRLQAFISLRKPGLLPFAGGGGDGVHIIIEEAERILSENKRFRRILTTATDSSEKESAWFAFVNEVSEAVIKCFAENIMKSLSGAKLFNVFQAVGSAGSVYTMLAPFFMSFRVYNKDRHFADACSEAFFGSPDGPDDNKAAIAMFTDTFDETNGVALTLKKQLGVAAKFRKNLKVLTCSPESLSGDVVNFRPAGTYVLPEYPEMALHCPPLLKMLDYCHENGITRLHASTPGPVGLCALAIARVLNIPIHSTYHTAIPQYAAELTGDTAMEDVLWKYMVWFYNQMDTVYVPSSATGDELAGKGVSSSKIRLYPRGIDIDHFHPSKNNGYWHSEWKIPDDDFKLLYVGRVSKEKNLDVLVDAFQILKRTSEKLRLIIVGDGPYRTQLERRLGKRQVLFTGYLEGEALASAYASSDLFVFPSVTDTFGNVVLEAQASGLPVIVSDRGGPEENVVHGESGLVIPAIEGRSLARTIMELFRDDMRIRSMKSSARKYVETRSFESAFLETWDLYTGPRHKGRKAAAWAA